jgi:WS/DGAT/MGAT family acyltransferase
MHVGSLMILDPVGAPDFTFESVMDLYARRLASVPELRARVVEVPLGLDRPVLADDPHFDLEAHCHRTTLRAPGTRRELERLTGHLLARKLDRNHPLWETWWIDGLDDGKVAFFVKMHHTLVDGVSGMHLAAMVMDTEPTPGPDPEPLPPAEPSPSIAHLGVGAMRSLAAIPWRSLRFANQLAHQTVTMIREVRRPDSPPLPFSAPRSPFNGAIRADRRVGSCTLPMDDIRTVKRAYGTTVNDVVLTVVGGALRRYLDARGELPTTPLVAQVPVSVHTDGDLDNLGTQVVNMFTTLGTDVAGNVDRLRVISSVTTRAKEYQHAIFADRAISLPDLVPPFVISAVARAFTGSGLERRLPPLYNAIVSDVHGSPVDLYVCGARVEALIPFGPLLLGSALNITALSHCDTMNVGIVATPDAVPDPSMLGALMEAELADLVDATRSGP